MGNKYLPELVIAIDESINHCCNNLYFLNPRNGVIKQLKRVTIIVVYGSTLERSGKEDYVQNGIRSSVAFIVGGNLKNGVLQKYTTYGYEANFRYFSKKLPKIGYDPSGVPISVCNFCRYPEYYDSRKSKLEKIFGGEPPRNLMFNEGRIEHVIDNAARRYRWELEEKLRIRGDIKNIRNGAAPITLSYLEKLGLYITPEFMELYNSKLAT